MGIISSYPNECVSTPNKLTYRSGRKYGFVRFKGVGDVGTLEQQLYNLIISGLKLHANLLKHGRERKMTGKSNIEEQYKKGLAKDKIVESDKDQGRKVTKYTSMNAGPLKQHPHRMTTPILYARVVATGNKIMGKRWIQGTRIQ